MNFSLNTITIKIVLTSSAFGMAVFGVGGAIVFIAAGGTATLLPPIMIGAGLVVGIIGGIVIARQYNLSKNHLSKN